MSDKMDIAEPPDHAQVERQNREYVITRLQELVLQSEIWAYITQELPDTIGKPELEAYLILLHASNCEFPSKTALWRYIINNLPQKPKRYLRTKDKSYYMGKTGLLQRLLDAKLIERIRLENRRRKKTWNRQAFIIQHYEVEQERTKIQFLMSPELLIKGLESYLYAKHWNFPKQPELPIDANKLLSVLHLGSVDVLASLFPPNHLEQIRRVGKRMS